MADHRESHNTHNPTVNKRIKQLKSQKKVTGGDAPALSPASILHNVKDKATARAPINRGKATKNPSPEEILRAKKQSIAKKERR